MSSFDLGLFIKATIHMYAECALKAAQGLYRCWIVVIAACVSFYVFQYIGGLLAGLGLGGRFLAGFIGIALLALYYGWISETVRGRTVRIQDLIQFDYALFFQVMSVAFIFMIIDFVFGGFSGDPRIALFTQLGITVICNAIPETLYYHRYEGMHALGHAATFTRDNWIEWFLPLTLLMAPLIVVNPEWAVVVLAKNMVLLPALLITDSWQFAASYYGIGPWVILLSIIVGHWFVLFRGFLFESLESGTRRRRMFQAK